MDRKKFRREFIEEIAFFHILSKRCSEKGLTSEQVEDYLIRFSSSLYGSITSFDEFAIKKCYFVSSHPGEVMEGKVTDQLLSELCDNLEEEERVNKIIGDHNRQL